jgi:hypothetical protein
MTRRTYFFELKLSDEQLEKLDAFALTPAIGNSLRETRANPKAARAKVLEYLVARVCDGARRPGSWERGVVQQLFGCGSAFYFTKARELADEASEAGAEGRA